MLYRSRMRAPNTVLVQHTFHTPRLWTGPLVPPPAPPPPLPRTYALHGSGPVRRAGLEQLVLAGGGRVVKRLPPRGPSPAGPMHYQQQQQQQPALLQLQQPHARGGGGADGGADAQLLTRGPDGEAGGGGAGAAGAGGGLLVVVSHEDQPADELAAVSERIGRPPVTCNWLFDSVSRGGRGERRERRGVLCFRRRGGRGGMQAGTGTARHGAGRKEGKGGGQQSAA